MAPDIWNLNMLWRNNQYVWLRKPRTFVDIFLAIYMLQN
jgi:hypothetical protein